MAARLRCWAVAAAAAAAAAAFAPAAADAAGLQFCKPSLYGCARLEVPVDRSGAVPGTIALQVERRAARRPVRPPLVVISPVGVGGTPTIGSETRAVEALLGGEANRRDVIVLDQRGTGESAALRCPPLQRVLRRALHAELAEAAGACAERLGPRRGFQRTEDGVADLEALRAALDVPRIALLGLSDGTKVAFEYARRHPERVERMVLDSPSPPDAPDPLFRSRFAAAPQVVRAFCRQGACRHVTRDAGGDLARLAARIERRPLRGRVYDGRGRPVRTTLRPTELVEMLAESAVREDVPAAVRSALRGDPAPILRTARLAGTSGGEAFRDSRVVSAATIAATACEEAPLPWRRDAPPSDRRRQAREAVERMDPGAFAPFGPEAALSSPYLTLCERWPAASPEPARDATTPVQGVPTLLIAGDEDVVAPLSDVSRVRALIPGSTLLTVRGAAHLPLLTDLLEECAVPALRSFLRGAPLARCPDHLEPNDVSPPFPRSLRDVRPLRAVPGRPGRTLAAAHLALQDLSRNTYGAVIATLFSRGRVREGGLRGGAAVISSDPDRLRLHRLAFVEGVHVSGTIDGWVLNDSLRGRLTIGGRAAARGTLTVRGGRVSGRLGGTPVRLRLGLDQDSLAGVG
jgi:pimeloyl-ACP methyl ester carboxylesterase